MPRKRASSVKQVIENIEQNPSHHLAGPFNDVDTPMDTPPTPKRPLPGSKVKRPTAPPVSPSGPVVGESLWDDVKTMNWMRSPASSFKLLLIPIVLFLNWHFICPEVDNPFKYCLWIQYRLPDKPGEVTKYRKGYGDLAFLAYYIVVFSFIRQSLTIHVLRPLAYRLGIRKEAKLDRFAEQVYSVIYYSVFGVIGVCTMWQLDTWYFNTPNFWLDYPYWAMIPTMKAYYLLQFAFWTQQLLILALRLEKPRKDFTELTIHHFVTIWLIGWSYLVNMTKIGNAVFITMDISDVFLAFAKSLNYLKLEKTSAVAFAFFVGVWTYTRHYLNFVLLWTIWYEYDLIPSWGRQWVPEKGVWLVQWMKYQMFYPILILQALNLFWYFLIWRILIRAIFGTKKLDDDRSDDEDDGEPDDEDNEKED